MDIYGFCLYHVALIPNLLNPVRWLCTYDVTHLRTAVPVLKYILTDRIVIRSWKDNV